MYRISIKGGESLGFSDSVNYIKIHESGCFTPATKEDAIGVAFRNVPYNLDGHADIPDAETVVVVELDAAYAFDEVEARVWGELDAAYQKGVDSV